METNMIYRIRKDIEGCIGKRIILRANKGRKRVVTKRGVIEEVYPNLFIVRLEKANSGNRTVSFTYSDVLTRTVEITLCANQQMESSRIS